MKLEDALNICQPNQYMARDAWIEKGILMKMVTSAKTIEEVKKNMDLLPESLNADDWNIYQICE